MAGRDGMQALTEHLIRRFLRHYRRPLVPTGAVVLVFAGDNFNRMKAAAELRRASPRHYILSGRPHEVAQLRDLALGYGIPASSLVAETRATNTITNARNCVRMLRGWRGPVILVTDDWHMPRAAWLCAWYGRDPLRWCATGTASETHIRREARTWWENGVTVFMAWLRGGGI